MAMSIARDSPGDNRAHGCGRLGPTDQTPEMDGDPGAESTLLPESLTIPPSRLLPYEDKPLRLHKVPRLQSIQVDAAGQA